MMGHGIRDSSNSGYSNVGCKTNANQLTRTEMNLYASRDSTSNRRKKPAVMAKLAFFTIDQIGTRFLFPFVPSSSSVAIAKALFNGGSQIGLSYDTPKSYEPRNPRGTQGTIRTVSNRYFSVGTYRSVFFGI